MQKKHGRKIKRVKSLYKPRKSRSRKALEIAAMIVAVCGLGFVGWNIGSAILNYSPPGGQYEIDREPLTVPADTEPDEPGDPGLSDGAENSGSAPLNAIIAPSSVLDNITSLAAYVRQAQQSGFNAVVLEVKDSTGQLFYASGYEPIADSDIMRGTLTAGQIYNAFEDTGVKPVIRLNTLLDSLAPRVLGDVSYVFAADGGRWADDFLDNGGKLWANPFLQGTRDYHLFIIEELVNAGFTDIILANTIFPHFRSSDRSILAPEYTEPAARFEGLAGFVKTLEASGAALYLEMTVRDVVENYAGFNNTAELLRGKNNLNGFGLLLVYNKDDFGAEYRTGEQSTAALPTDIGALASVIYKQAANKVSGFEITPLLSREGLSDREIADVLSAFGELGFESFIIR
ncbi:MAG: putative glycoside hydrolase [Oscillospiraceae bacterium]|nr:putative glycoside hydrolase [Oscillospiraceae bacterium]